jgi:hypothetical protein
VHCIVHFPLGTPYCHETDNSGFIQAGRQNRHFTGISHQCDGIVVDNDLVDDRLDSCLSGFDTRFAELAADQLGQRPDLGAARIGIAGAAAAPASGRRCWAT